MKILIHAAIGERKTLKYLGSCFLVVLLCLPFSSHIGPVYAQEPPGTFTGRIFVDFGTIEGDSTVKDYVGWSEVTGVGFIITSDMDEYSASRAYFEGLKIVKPIAVDSPKLALVCSNGEFLQEVTIDFVQLRGTPFLIYRIILHNVRIQSVVSGSEFIGDSLKETIRLFADKVEWIWQKYSGRGVPIDQVRGC